MFDAGKIRRQFPIFSHYPQLAYLDNASTTQKPKAVIDSIANFYEKGNANIHRGVYELAARATQQYEGVRQKVAGLIGAPKPETIVYTSGTTAGINLVAQSFLEPRLQAGDEVVISYMEHHANLIPWQMACKRKGAKLRVVPMGKDGVLDLAAYREMLSPRTRMVALVHVSNTLGTVNPIEEMIALAHQQGVPVLVDGAQSIAHFPIDVRALDVDFLVFSGHKMYGPTGVGILYGKEERLAAMPPWQFGGDMIRDVAFEETTFAEPPQRFEAGTTPIAGVIGLGAAVDFLQALDKNEIQQHLKKLGQAAREELARIDGLTMIGNAAESTAIVSFVLENVHPHDVATFLAEEQIAVRAGHHCTQPIMDFFGIAGTTRASFTIYNDLSEIERLAQSLKAIQQFFLG
ncbi:MAG: cysteine desulfurase [Lewinellaceae bacterium]|nr:cysteine desulfurase [Phaeodactylibacter sp.]MCB9039262.1 cysteine desulfurase [Lewinellaceae bacterium]